jgi:hypothetical protein
MSHVGAPKNLSPAPSWREIAARASTEIDPKRLSELVGQLCAKLEEEQQKRKRLRRPSHPSPMDNLRTNPRSNSPEASGDGMNPCRKGLDRGFPATSS